MSHEKGVPRGLGMGWSESKDESRSNTVHSKHGDVVRAIVLKDNTLNHRQRYRKERKRDKQGWHHESFWHPC